MITLSSDFGSPYPAAMRGVLLSHDPQVRLVDVAHDLPRQDVRAAAFWTRFVLPEFPPSTHLLVVDPGVGTDRAALAVRAGDHALVAPDNGVALPAARALAGEQAVEVFAYAYDEPASNTFHGRDVFAPLAAAVHEVGADRIEELDRVSPAEEYVDHRLPEADVADDGLTARGEVLVVDDFGNAITNVPGAFLAGLDDGDRVRVNGEEVPVGESFASVAEGERLVTVGSHAFVECDVNRGRGDEAFGLSAGDEVVVEREE
ncbi:S-adenosyl-l-methionine hydroxide adenosyltransferase [Salinigranum rubrum]|uniref:S-adenosyl-l-methionine hydroxide adenosyltransferase n=1 Tax=Salinigranum rubrum TaxID=755307 RepID=A0A2I8VPM8_9EURY|nr:SAM-dependent chlorinase/fluorinase [Salinigranum rubrum]AUV83881.1 S-adenosyl-l-methionine hydroxide adenosyltransferase [Salinigranum rubrum]